MTRELKPRYWSRFKQTHLNNATILYQRKSYCAYFVLLAVQIESWKAKIFCAGFPIEIKENVQKITQIPFAWDFSFPQTPCTLEGKGRGNLTSFQNLFKFPFHDLQPTVCDNEVGNCSCFWEDKHRNCGDYSMSKATNKKFSFFPSSPLSPWLVRLCIRICMTPDVSQLMKVETSDVHYREAERLHRVSYSVLILFITFTK